MNNLRAEVKHLYHVSYDKPTRLFTPRVPEINKCSGENHSIPRICLSESPALCTQAIYTSAYPAVGKEFWLYEFLLPLNKLITPEELYSSGKVPDALENREYWYCEELEGQPIKCKLTAVRRELTLAWTCIRSEQVHEVIQSLNPVYDNQNDSSQSIYDTAIKYADEVADYNFEDDLWDALAILPWAQKNEITVFEYARVGAVHKINSFT